MQTPCRPRILSELFPELLPVSFKCCVRMLPERNGLWPGHLLLDKPDSGCP